MRMRLLLVATLIMGALGGCGGGPDGETLKKDVSERVAQALPEGTVTVASFERRGSQADPKAPAGETRRTVYFDVELKLARDFDFGAWDSPGVAGIVSALGTAPKGIVGITSGGNKAGDVVRAHGTALYRRDGDEWAAVVSGAHRPAVAPAYATNAPQGAAAMLEAMRRTIDAVPKDAGPAQRAVIEEELAVATATIKARLARANDGYPIAAGPEHGQYLRFVHALSDEKSTRTLALLTRGGEENLRLLRDRKVSLAMAQGDSALAAYEGKGNFAADGPYPDLRAIGSLYPEPMHVLVRADGAVKSMSELRGRRVAIGVAGSASRPTALRVLEAHGLSVKDIKPLELSIGDALVALRDKEADAVMQVIGMPADSIRDALVQIPLRLIPLSERAVATLAAANAGYFAFSIPRGAYATQKEDVRTVATAALLVTGTDLTESEIARVTRHVFEKGRDLAARGSAQAAQVSPANARTGLSVPLHAAAAKALDAMTTGAKPAAIPARK